MATLSIRSPASTLAQSLGARLLAAFQAFRAQRARAHAAKRLSDLDDFLLKDVGVDRDDIPALVQGLTTDRKHGHEDTMV